MTYIELINNFWNKTAANPCTPLETSLYFYLLQLSNQAMWQNPFEVRTRDLELKFGVGRKYIGIARKGLFERGFIKFCKGVGSGKSIYIIDGLKVENKVLYDLFVFHMETQLETQLETQNKIVFPYETQLETQNDTDTYYIETKVSNINKDSKDYIDPPHPPSEKPKIYEEIKKFEKFSTMYFDAVKREHNLSREDVLALLPKFADWCVCDGKESHYSTKDLTSHFNKWLKYHLKPKYEKKYNGSTRSGLAPTGMRSRLAPAPGCGLIERTNKGP